MTQSSQASVVSTPHSSHPYDQFGSNYFYEIHIYYSETIKELIVDCMQNLAVKYCFIGKDTTSTSRSHINLFIEFWNPYTASAIYRFIYGLRPLVRGHCYVRSSSNRESILAYLINKYRDNYIESSKNLLNQIIYHVHGTTVELCYSDFDKMYDSNGNKCDSDDDVSVHSLHIED